MTQLMGYADYLSKEIGPRPAGTEEEQQAALYITEQFQKDSGFPAQIEEFTSTSNIEWIKALPGIIVIVAAILAMIFPMLSIPAFILAAASAALYTLEAFGNPIVTRALGRGASQNVVARYQPSGDAAPDAPGPSRRRKIVLIAHYDSGKVTPALVRTVESTKLPVPIGMVCVGGIVLAALLQLVHIFVNAGIPGIIVNVLTVIALIICAYPVLRTLMFRMAPYNEGANNNATGTAALLEVARRISRGSVSEADLAETGSDGVRIHGEEAARESGLVPEGAQIRYEAEQLTPPAELGEYDEEERLLAAKAAIAAMTGQPVERRVYGSVADKLVNSRAKAEEPTHEEPAAFEAVEGGEGAHDAVPQTAAFPNAVEGQVPVVEEQRPMRDEKIRVEPIAPISEAPSKAEGFENAPSWFVTAQQNAKKPTGDTGPIQRSRYAEAIEAAEREAAAREQERNEQERIRREADLKAREAAARAAIAAAAPDVQRAPVEQPQEPIVEPVFVPYEEAQANLPVEPKAQPNKPAQPEGKPVDDEFAASLGSTQAFDPRQLQEDGESAPVESKPQSRLADLPAIGAEETAPIAKADEAPETTAPETTSPSRSGLFRMLRTDVPSLSGVIRMQEAGEDVSQVPAQAEAAPAPAATPVLENLPKIGGADEPLAQNQPEKAEPVDYDMKPAEFEGYEVGIGGYNGENADVRVEVDMPKSRTSGLIDGFRQKGPERLEETPQEWLGVDEDFDARTVGRERGGWESFRDDAPLDENEPRGSHGRWEGGSYSRVRLGHVDTRSGEGTDISDMDEPISFDEESQIVDEIEQIYHFRNPLYETEIWFVALGSEGASHSGAKAFIAEHGDDLRGAMVIEIESLGAGELCVASAEGRVKVLEASSRIKRYTRAATAVTGIAPGSVNLAGTDSASSIMQAAGYQTMHLLGVENGKPALKGSPDDIMENIDELLLDDNVNFLMELLKK